MYHVCGMGETDITEDMVKLNFRMLKIHADKIITKEVRKIGDKDTSDFLRKAAIARMKKKGLLKD